EKDLIVAGIPIPQGFTGEKKSYTLACGWWADQLYVTLGDEGEAAKAIARW
ncbi:unnamed protein product, partial [Effrenium voratum]